MACSRAVVANWCGSGRWDQRGVLALGSTTSKRRNVAWRLSDIRNRGIARSIVEAAAEGPRSGFRKNCRSVVWRVRATAVAVAAEEKGVQEAKFLLLSSLIETGRGLKATPEQRANVEEATVGVEKFYAGMSLELDKLDGTWLLQFTTAPDVIQILQASESPFLKVGQIYQKFECKGSVEGGVVRNVVKWSIPGILQDDDGATFVVKAAFSVVSPRSISLRFEEAEVGQVAISEEFQGLLAPAALPRTFFTFQILQFFRTLSLQVPLLRPTTPAAERSKRVPIGSWYYLTYLDNDLLVGRSLGSGGVFIFRRTQDLQLSKIYKYHV